MKVVLVRNAFTHDFGGAERLAVLIASELQLHDITTLVVSRQPRLLAFASERKVPTRRGLWWRKQNFSGASIALVPVYILWQIILTCWYIQLFIRTKPDVVHLLSKDDFIGGSIAAKLLGKPLIWTDTADLKFVWQNHPVWYKNPVGKLVYWASRLPNYVTLVSHNEKRLVEEALGHHLPEKFVVVHSVGKDEVVVPNQRAARDKDAIVFCATSRLVVAKGIGELVQVFNVLSKENDQYRLWLVGDGPDEAQFKQLAGDNPYITFVGHSDQPLGYVAASDVFVHPTYHEGFSLALAEAAMLGKPMIASLVGGNPELVNEQNGILFPSKDVAALTSAMRELAADPARRTRLGAQARQGLRQ